MRVGIIGCGMITAKRHAPEFAANPNASLKAWFDMDAQRAQAFAEQYGGRVFSDWKALIDSGDCDAVSVCTPNDTHADIAVYALNHGLHVLCEKPMATSLEQCTAMVRAAEENGCVLLIGQNQRMLEACRAAKQMITDGKIGRVLSVQTSFGHAGPEKWSKTKNSWFFDKARAGHGAMFDLGIHKTDLVRYLLGDEIVEVAAFGGTLDKKTSDGELIGVDDNAVAIFRMKSGALGQLTASWTHYARESNYTRVFGTKGMLCLYEDGKAPLVVAGLDGQDEGFEFGGIQTNDNQFASGIIDAFVRSIVEKAENPIAGADVLHSMQATFAMIRSFQTGTFQKTGA